MKTICAIAGAFIFACTGMLRVACASQKAECVVVESVPTGALLTLRGPVVTSSTSPGKFCSLLSDKSYKLRVERPNYEGRTLVFRISSQNRQFEFSGTTLGNVAKSAVLPGWGQSQGGGLRRTFGALLSGAAGGVLVTQSYLEYRDARDRHDALVGALEHAQTDAERTAMRGLTEKAAMDANQYRQHMIYSSIVAGWIYTVNLLEAALLSAPPGSQRVDGSSFRVSIPRSSRPRALLRSVVSPGWGQKYRGSAVRGFLFQGTFLTMVVLALDAQRRYDLATVDYEFARRGVAEASTLDELQRARAEAADKWETCRDRDEGRTVYFALAGGVWALNVLDVLLFGNDHPEPSLVGFDVSPDLSRSLKMGMTVRF